MRILLTAGVALAVAAGLSGCVSTALAVTDAVGARSAPPQDDLMALMAGASPEEAERIAARVARHPLGSQENPVRADMPGGQRAYLARLRCSDGRMPAFERIGSFGDGPYRSIIDGYQVNCAAGATPASTVVYLDMYRRGHVETKAVPGFTIVAP